jgi:hypothetical protein
MFITYETIESTLRAIEMFNNNVRLPGAANPLQMRPADSQTGHDRKFQFCTLQLVYLHLVAVRSKSLSR